MRRRVFSLLVADYDTVQHYGSFLFWGLGGGWEQYVPSLWSGRATGPGAKPEETPDTPEETPREPE